MNINRKVGSVEDDRKSAAGHIIGLGEDDNRRSCEENPAVFFQRQERKSLASSSPVSDVRIDVMSQNSSGNRASANTLRDSETRVSRPNMAYVAMNTDPDFVRKASLQFVENAEGEENEVPDLPGRDKLEKEKLHRSSTSGTARASSLHLHPDRFSIRKGVSRSMSIPINKMSIKIYGSEKAVVEEQKRLKKAGRFIIHPYSNFRLIWDTLTLILLLTNIILIPFAIAFWKEDNPAWLPFKAFSDVWFLVDIILNFRTGIVLDGPDSEIILDPKQIRIIYLKTWFAVDFISTFPFDLPFTLTNKTENEEGTTAVGDSRLKALTLLRLAKILALLRLLRVSRFIRYIKQWEEIFNFQYEVAIALIRILNLILLMLFICHFNGCLQYMVPMFLNFPEGTWVQVRNLQREGVSNWERYSWSVFKSTSHMLCIGYGQFPPKSIIDLWVTYFSMCTGAMCFALFIGNATSLIQSMDASKRSYKEKYMQVKEYMQFRKLPSKLRRKISDYYENKYQGKMFDENMILSELNHNLREEVITFNCKELVDQVPFFSDGEPDFVSEVLQRLSFEVFLPGELVIKEGTVGDKMYFINHGTVRIFSKEHNVTQNLSDGCYFGEIALLQQNQRRVASVEAETYCYLYTLSVKDFNEVISSFPKQRAKLLIVAQNRLHAPSSNLQDSFTSTCSIVPVDAAAWNASRMPLEGIEEEEMPDLLLDDDYDNDDEEDYGNP